MLQIDRLNPAQVLDYYIRTPDGIAHAGVDDRDAEDSSRAGIDQSLPAAQFRDDLGRVAPSGLAGPGARLHAQGPAGSRTFGLSDRLRGPSRQFVQESGGFVVTLLFAVIIVFLALAAQFESFRDPTVILVSVPHGAVRRADLHQSRRRLRSTSTRRWGWSR